MLRSILLMILFPAFYSVTAQSTQSTDIQWAQSLEAAKSDARIQGKKIFLYFSGSDWCKPCIQLREKQIDSEIFQEFAKNNLILLQADFPRLKKNQPSKTQIQQNEALAEKYNIEGAFPLIVLLTAEGEVLGKTGYRDETPDKFVQRIKLLVHPL